MPPIASARPHSVRQRADSKSISPYILKMMMCAQNPKAAVDSLHVKKLIVLLVALGALLSACTGQIRIQDGHDGNEGGGFCPPGQAKKGNC